MANMAVILLFEKTQLKYVFILLFPLATYPPFLASPFNIRHAATKLTRIKLGLHPTDNAIKAAPAQRLPTVIFLLSKALTIKLSPANAQANAEAAAIS